MKTQMQLKENKQINADQQSFLREIAKYMKFYSKHYNLKRIHFLIETNEMT